MMNNNTTRDGYNSISLKVLTHFFLIITIFGAIYWGLIITHKIPIKKSVNVAKKSNTITPELIKDISKDISMQEKMKIANNISNWILKNYYRSYPQLTKRISQYLMKESKIPFLMIGLVGAESSFVVQNKSSVDAYGLGQIRYNLWKKEAKQFGINCVNDCFDPIKNLKLSEYILLKNLKKTGNIKDALSLYQTGYLLRKLKYKQRMKTLKYINKVLSITGNVYAYVNLKLHLKNG